VDNFNVERTRVQVFSTTYCGYCRRADELLTTQGIPFETIDVTTDWATRRALVERADGRRTVPVIFVDDQPIGGYQELARLLAAGKLDHLKRQVSAA
jgi:glutaredoxin 3